MFRLVLWVLIRIRSAQPSAVCYSVGGGADTDCLLQNNVEFDRDQTGIHLVHTFAIYNEAFLSISIIGIFQHHNHCKQKVSVLLTVEQSSDIPPPTLSAQCRRLLGLQLQTWADRLQVNPTASSTAGSGQLEPVLKGKMLWESVGRQRPQCLVSCIMSTIVHQSSCIFMNSLLQDDLITHGIMGRRSKDGVLLRYRK